MTAPGLLLTVAQPARTTTLAMGLICVSSFIGSFGAVFLKAGAARLHDGWRYLFLNPKLVLGVILFAASSLFYVIAMRQGELSVLYPLVSLSYIWALIWSRLFFNERLTRNKFAGLALILLGIVFIGIGRG